MKSNQFTLPTDTPTITRSSILAMPDNRLDAKSLAKLSEADSTKHVFAHLIPGNGLALFWGTGGEAKLATFADKSGIRRVILDDSSTSAPLNLCPPAGITGTTLEAHSPGCICAACVPPLFSPIPASPVKDTPDFSGLAPIFDKAELASMKAAASPVEVPVHTPVPYSFGKASEEVIAADGTPIAACPDGADYDQWLVNGPFIAESCNSHAAKDAKIRALEQALKDCVESLSRLPDTEGAYRVTCLESAKAALALPCAPFGS